MEDTNHPWEQQDCELEEGLILRKKNLNQIPISMTINGGVTNGEQKQEQEHEQEPEPEQEEDVSEENGINIDEDDNKKEKEYSVYYDTDKGIINLNI